MRPNGRRTMTAVAALLLLLAMLMSSLGGGLVQPQTAMAGGGTGVTVSFSSLGTGNMTFTSAGNGTSANDVLVVPGQQITISLSFSQLTISDRAHVREDISGLSIDANTATAPIVWGWAPAAQPYVLGIFPQDTTGVDLNAPVFIRVFAINTILTVTPNVVVADGTLVTMIPAYIPAATTQYEFTAGEGIGPIVRSTASYDFQYSVPGRYIPSVRLLNAQGQEITSATGNAVLVKYAEPHVICSMNNPQVGQEFQCDLVGADYLFSTDQIKWGWTDHNGLHEFNSAEAYRRGEQNSPNIIKWTADRAEALNFTVVLERSNGSSFDELARASTQINVQSAPVANSSVSMTMPASAVANQQVSISLVANDVTDGEYAIILTGLPGVNAYNPVNDPAVVKTRNGKNVSMVVPFAFPSGDFTVRASLDVVRNGSWVPGVSSAQSPIHVTQTGGGTEPFTPTIKLNVPQRATINTTTTLQIDVTGIGSAENAVRLLGLPSGEYNVSLAAAKGEVRVENIQGGKRYTVPFKFSSTGSFGLIVRLDVVHDGAWMNNAAVDQKTVVVAMNTANLPLVMKPATQVSISVSPAQPKLSEPVVLNVNQANGYSFQANDQMIWTLPTGEYNSTVGAANGEQAAPTQVKFWAARGTHTVTLHIDREVNGQWTKTAVGTVTFTVR